MSGDETILRADDRSLGVAQERRRRLLREIAAILDVPVESIVASARDAAAADQDDRFTPEPDPDR